MKIQRLNSSKFSVQEDAQNVFYIDIKLTENSFLGPQDKKDHYEGSFNGVLKSMRKMKKDTFQDIEYCYRVVAAAAESHMNLFIENLIKEVNGN